jgi:hypothetical protein
MSIKLQVQTSADIRDCFVELPPNIARPLHDKLQVLLLRVASLCTALHCTALHCTTACCIAYSHYQCNRIVYPTLDRLACVLLQGPTIDIDS